MLLDGEWHDAEEIAQSVYPKKNLQNGVIAVGLCIKNAIETRKLKKEGKRAIKTEYRVKGKVTVGILLD
jgi:hypothetical protein